MVVHSSCFVQARLQQQFINQQTLHLKATDESESKLNEVRLSLKKVKYIFDLMKFNSIKFMYFRLDSSKLNHVLM